MTAETDRAGEVRTLLREIEGGPSQLVVGRLVFFLRHLPSLGWRIALLMNSHVRPVTDLS